MCGITGFVNRDGRPAERAVLERMTAALAHRGPDGDGHYCAGPVALGHRRLSIIDVAGGAQPLSNEDGTVWVSYNGELYNELELRRELLAKGHRYRTASDTESLVHLYEEEGPAFVERLNGMFALALWDARRGRLVLARDRMGQKPLYYGALPGGGLAFASEPKALRAHPEIGRELDPAGLARYLFYEYVPAPFSIWRGVRKLPRGHRLVWDVGSNAGANAEAEEIAPGRYWPSGFHDGPETAPEEAGPLFAQWHGLAQWHGRPARDTRRAAPPGSFSAAAEAFWDVFRAAVARHRRSDVPLGVFLSGGVDSSSVAAALRELEPDAAIHTFSIGFDDASFDEGRHARAVARHLGTAHHERTFSVESARGLLPEVAAWLDEPFADASILPTHLLSRFARETVKVALGGDGADELLAGYPTFAAERLARLFRRLPASARALAGAAAGRLPVDHRNFSLDFKLKQFLKGAAEPPALAHQRWLGAFSGAEIDRLLVRKPPIDVEAEHLARALALPGGGGGDGDGGPLARALALYQDTYLPEDILTKVDRASMACGLEVRAPFLDAELVDFVQALPPSFHMKGRQTKRLLKRAAAGRLPASILGRPKKGFGIPVAQWLRGPLAPMVDDLLGRERLERQGTFRPEEVARLVAEHRAGARDHRKPLWALLMFQLWRRNWLD